MTRQLTDMERLWLDDLAATVDKFRKAETDDAALNYINQAINLLCQLRGFYVAKRGECK